MAALPCPDDDPAPEHCPFRNDWLDVADPIEDSLTSVTIDEAKTQFAELIAQIERGEEVIITCGGKPVARPIPYLPQRGFGSMRGKAWLDESF